MAKRDELDFFKLSAEEQAKAIEKETKKLLDRLPTLKKNLKMYGEVSDELYNLEPEEVEQIGSTYARAVRGGEISTPSSQRAYQKFIKDLRRYTRPSIQEISKAVADKRMDSWMETIKSHGSLAEQEYAEKLIEQMDDEDKLAFTRSRYFLDTDNWNSQDTFVKEVGDEEYSIMTLKLELFMEGRNKDTDGLYEQASGTKGKRKYTLKRYRRKK